MIFKDFRLSKLAKVWFWLTFKYHGKYQFSFGSLYWGRKTFIKWWLSRLHHHLVTWTSKSSDNRTAKHQNATDVMAFQSSNGGGGRHINTSFTKRAFFVRHRFFYVYVVKQICYGSRTSYFCRRHLWFRVCDGYVTFVRQHWSISGKTV